MSEDHIWKARCTAGRAAVIIADSHDRETARDMTRGLLMGFLEAAAQYDGWDSALQYAQQVASTSRTPAVVTAPKLRVVK